MTAPEDPRDDPNYPIAAAIVTILLLLGLVAAVVGAVVLAKAALGAIS